MLSKKSGLHSLSKKPWSWLVILTSSCLSLQASEGVQITGLSPFPCTPSSATMTSNPIPNSEVEPSIDVANIPHFGTVIAAAYQQDRYNSGGGCNADYMRLSFDKGHTWGEFIPLPNVFCFNGPYERASDPGVRISQNGSVYFTGLGFNFTNILNAVTVARYDLKKEEFTSIIEIDPITSLDAQVIDDFPSLTLEPLDNCGNTMYLTWDQFLFSGVDPNFEYGLLRFSKSTDGETWSPPTTIYGLYPDFEQYSPDVQVTGARIELLDNPCSKTYSRLVDIACVQTGLVDTDIPLKNFYISLNSKDQGKSWSPATIINPDGLLGTAVDPDDYTAIIRAGDGVPGTAADRKRNLLYAAIQQHSLIVDSIPSQIDLYVSKNAGKDWTYLGPVNTDLSVQAFNQAISVVDDGKIAVSYYDFRNHTPNPNTGLPLETDRWLAVYNYNSKTNSLTFEDETRLTPESFNMRLAPNLASTPISPPGYFLGDYQEMKYLDKKLYMVYGVTESVNNPSDIIFQKERF